MLASSGFGHDFADDSIGDGMSDYIGDDYDASFQSMLVSSDTPTYDMGGPQDLGDLSYKPPRRESNRMSDAYLKAQCVEYNAESYVKCSMYDKSAFYTLQAEILVNKRRFKEALSASLVAEELSGPSKVLDAVKMICMYQLSDDVRFRELKEQFVTNGFSGLSDSLKQQAIGTIQVSNWIPEFLNCLDQMKPKE